MLKFQTGGVGVALLYLMKITKAFPVSALEPGADSVDISTLHLMKLTKVSLTSAVEPRAGSVGVSLRSSFLARWTRMDTRLC